MRDRNHRTWENLQAASMSAMNNRRPVSLPKVSMLAVVLLLCLDAITWGSTFMPSHLRSGGRLSPNSLRGAHNIALASRTRHGAIQTTVAKETPMSDHLEYGQEIEELLYPAESMWITESPDVIKQYYPGSRNFWSIFWAIIVPLNGLGFLTVGLSTYFGFDLIDLNPITSEYLWMLRTNHMMAWVPQGVFMTFWGVIACFFIAPIFAYSAITNAGNGVCRFDKKEQKMQVIRDGELFEEHKFSEIDHVLFEWSGQNFMAPRQISLVKPNGGKILFYDNIEPEPRRIIERKATRLAEFLGKPLQIDDTE